MYKEKSYIVRDHDQISNNLSDYLQKHDQKDMLRFLTCGGVDDGKSTLIGRLLYDSQMIYEDQMSSLMRDSRDFGTTNNNFDPALLTDGLRAEREQGITIDVAYRYFSTEKRSFIVCDCPGHEQYTRNMATGASHCNLAIILIDACRGVMPQTKRHSFIASVMGIKHIVVAVNKMDIMDYDQQIYHDIRNSYEAFAAKLEVNDIHFIPVSALKGDNIVNPGGNMPWFKGEPLLSYLENVRIASDRNLIDFRFPVQYVLRHDNNFRGFAGTVASGSIRKGDRISVLPSGTPTRVRSIITCDGELNEAFAPQPVLITTTDEVEISRGCMLARPNNAPMIGSRFDAVLVWMDNDAANPGTKYLLKSATQTVPAEISEIRYKFDINTLHRQKDKNIRMNDISRVEITTHRPL
ncbi:MAG: GTP-binding protein, partial [Victivallaceae bacterium]